MAQQGLEPGGTRILARRDFPSLIDTLRGRGYRVVGPTVRGGAIVHDEIARVEDLPIGIGDEQSGGTYRLTRRDDEALFGYNAPAQSWRPFFFPPSTLLVRLRRQGESFAPAEVAREAPRLALLGARSCDLCGLAIQDLIFTGGPTVDPDYAARRAEVFVVAVQCGQAGGTCFCASMGTGPRAGSGFDLALTELLDGAHRFFVEVGSVAGAEVLAALATSDATTFDQRAAGEASERAVRSMGRRLATFGIKELLYRNLDHPRWDDVASRCLSCANCTLVCPTCFCHTVEDTTDLSGEVAERNRRWDSCFALDHSYLHGGSVHASTRSRYRQWLTHKVASWIDQFGMSGCVGCGRCITWCPVGIDLTEEVAAIRASDGAGREAS